MNTLLAIILAAQALSVQHTGTQAAVEYIPIGQLAYAQGCLALGSSDGIVMYCSAEHTILVMATNDKPLVD